MLQKPTQKSKARDHQECLTKRLALWKDGKIAELLREGRSVLKLLVTSHQKKDPPHKAKIFGKLVLEGQIISALWCLTDDGCGGVLSLNDDVMKQLHEKHPKEQYVNGKVVEWVGQVTKLAEFALSQPQACYAAFTYGLKHRWTYFLRTLPDLEEPLAPLERAIADVLIPSIRGHYCTQGERELLGLPVRVGGMGLTNPSQEASSEYVASANISGPLAQRIKLQVH